MKNSCHLLSQRPIVLCACLPADSSTPLQVTIVFLYFSPLLHGAPCLPADSPVSP
ncbi:hypothetical protein AVEN_103301-1, partial [Araneus ventricosus]